MKNYNSKKRDTDQKKQLCKVILIAAWLFLTLSAQAQNGDNQFDKTESRGSDKLDIKKLEQKYWAPKDEDFSVVQNRRYVKAQRYFLTAEGGIPFNDPYSTGTIACLSTGYFLNERWGLEFSYAQSSLNNNNAVSQFVQQYGAIPDHNIFRSSLFISSVFVPFYAKMSFMEKSIIYFDMGLTFGAGNLNYDISQKEGAISKSSAAIKLGIFQQIFFSEHFAMRVDLNNTWVTESQAKYYAPGTSIGGATVGGSRDLGSTTFNDTSLIFGITYWH